MPTVRTWALLSVLVIVLLIMYSLRRRDQSPASHINLEHLLLDDKGHTDPARTILMGTFIIGSWVIIYLTLRDKLTEGYMLAFLGVFASPAVAKIIFGKTDTSGMPQLPSSTVVTTTTQTEVQPTGKTE